METAIATIKRRLRILPTPKYAKTKKIDKDMEPISPRRVLVKRSEKVKSRAAKSNIKNAGTAAKFPGSTK